VGPFKIVSRPFPDEGYDPVALLKNMGYLPVEGWLVVNINGNGILQVGERL
jgi:hypothetical protein